MDSAKQASNYSLATQGSSEYLELAGLLVQLVEQFVFGRVLVFRSFGL